MLVNAAETSSQQAIPAAAQLCTSCHGAQGQGMGVIDPRLAGLSAEYINNQLTLFQTGKRQNPTMLAMAATVQGDNIAVVSEYFSQQPVADIPLQFRGDKVVISDPFEALAFQGDWSRVIPACTSCHDSSGVGGGQFPRLAGQEVSYLKTQLLSWQNGTRKGDVDNMMGNIAVKLTAAEIDGLSEFFANIK
ncbi:c-type cytochrome [Shewanella phaeophyticola]|uniref:C-type cytochrome n=1 Tax=Shewanella phaeophyticola TaxID=2978345 RepID=A0ABT2P594_9GAMM|nr:c-type cytochrome [Shewanella sp. KJ10-1]MCT8987823.1 c-type cytochrome [Shewanella sp. KJ10-1]